MARSSLQIAAGLLLLAGLLGLSTALIAEVREEVLQEGQEGQDPAREVRNRSPGLPVPELTLLDPTRAEVPDREHTAEGFTTREPATLHLDRGEGVQPGEVTLDQEARLVLGQGWDLDDDRLTCTDPCKLELEEAQLALPADAALVAPPTAPGFDLGNAPEPGTEVPVPVNTRLELPAIRFPAGTTLNLASGAQVELPGDPDDWASLLDTDPLQLPPGTVVTRSGSSDGDARELARMLGQAGRADRQAPEGLDAEEPVVRVTDTPASIEKGRPFEVVGVVERPNGDPSPGHPVTVFANATKQAPGLRLHNDPAQTDADGTFTARVLLPEQAPTQPYHLLAHAHPRPDADPPLEGAWSDPLLPVEGEAELRLDLPEATGIGVPLGLRAHLVDAYGAPVPGQPIAFTVEGTETALAARTDENGEAVTVLEEGLSLAGNYTVHARFPGTDNVTGDETQTTIEAVDARIQAPATHVALRGEATEIQGRVTTGDGDPGRVRVRATYADNVTATTDTDPQGRFTLELPVPGWLDPGNHTVELEAPAVDARHRLVLTARASLALVTPEIGPQPVGAQVPIPVDVVADDGTPVPGIGLTAHHDAGASVYEVTGIDGSAQLSVPVPSAGDHVVEIEPDTPYRYTAQPREIPIRAGPLTVDGDVRLAPGRTTNASLELSVADSPLPHTPVQLVGPGFVGQTTTDAGGEAKLELRLPEDTPPGTVTANLSLPAKEVTTSLPVPILAHPELSVRVDQAPREGQPLQITVRAQASGAPVSDVPVLARTEGAFQAQDQSLTDQDGEAQLSLARPDTAEGPVTIDVFADATDTTARAAQTASTEATPAPLPWAWIAAAAAALGIAALAGIRYHRGPGPDPETVDAGPRLSLQLGPEDGFGPVWHPDEPTTLRVRLCDEHGDPIPEARVHLQGPAGDRHVDLDEHGTARTRVPGHDPGTHTYRATYETDEVGVETVLEARIVDYREEIDRQYRRLRDDAVRLGLVDPDATPRELGRALPDPADDLARLFERFDYAPHPVDREDYERFMQLVQEADPRAPHP